MTAARLVGCGTALVTPFNADGSLDEAALRAFVDWQIDEGIHFLVPCGSTGEAATMTTEEHRRVVEIIVEQVSGRVPVVAGAGSNDTQKAIALSKAMRDVGATHLLHTSPMYNKPPQRGIVAHYRAIAEAVDLPIVVYNVPGRTGSNIEAKTTLEMAEITGIAAVKEASGHLSQIADIIRRPARGVLGALRRRRDDASRDGARRRRHHLRRLERDAEADGASSANAMRARRRRARARDPLSTAAVDARRVHRVESDAGQGGAGDDGPDAERASPPARADEPTRTTTRCARR